MPLTRCIGQEEVSAMSTAAAAPPALAMTLDTAGVHAGPAHPKLGLALPVQRDAAGPFANTVWGV